MRKTTYDLEERECILYSCDNIKYILIQPVDEHDNELLDGQVKYIEDEIGKIFALAAIRINDWNGELSPWVAEPVFGKEPFKGGAVNTLSFIEKCMIPDILMRCNLSCKIPIIIGGYSLAALFALWCGYETDTFTAIAAASPSVWFPDWIDYAGNKNIMVQSVYLSLGDKEEKAKNKTMATVGACIREQQDILNKCADVKVIFEWNEGNHFKDSDIRTGKAFAWCIKNIS